jgi:hypothetical protein
MKTYRVYFSFSHGGYYDIPAASPEEAEESALHRFTGEDEPSYHFQEGGGFEVLDVEPLKARRKKAPKK